MKTNKRNIESWVKRNRIPDKWRMILSQHTNPLAKLPLDNPELLEKILKQHRQKPSSYIEDPSIEYESISTLPVDIANIVEILKEFDTKQRRDVLRYVLTMDE